MRGKRRKLPGEFKAKVALEALAELLAFRVSADSFRKFARFSLQLGTLGALVTAPLGWAAATGASYPDLEQTLFLHRWSGTSTAALALVLLALAEVGYRRNNPRLLKWYRALLMVAAILVVITDHLGSTLIYGPDYYFG